MCRSPQSQHRVLGRRLNRSQGAFPRGKRGITTTVVKCQVCGLVFADPTPVPADLQNHYGIPPEEYWKEEDFKVPEAYFQCEIDRFKRLAIFRPGMRALDIGAGLGKAMIALQRAGFDTHGFEPSQAFRDQAIARMGIDPQRLEHSSLETAVYDSGSFDLITFGAVLEHLYDPALSLQRALEWLKTDGFIHIEVPSSDWLIARIINAVYKIQGSDHVANLSPMHVPFHMYEFALRSFKANGRELGYSVAHHEYFVCQTYLPKILDPLLRRYMKRTSTGMQLAVWLKKVAT